MNKRDLGSDVEVAGYAPAVLRIKNSMRDAVELAHQLRKMVMALCGPIENDVWIDPSSEPSSLPQGVLPTLVEVANELDSAVMEARFHLERVSRELDV